MFFKVRALSLFLNNYIFSDYRNICDVIEKFEVDNWRWCKLKKELKKIVLLIPLSGNFEKNKDFWPARYQMQMLEDENEVNYY